MNKTHNLSIPFILPAQAQKHVTYNEGMLILDALVHLAVSEEDRVTPPEEIVEGGQFIIGPNATGAWQGHDGELALAQEGAWVFLKPQTGWRAWSISQNRLLVFDGDTWTIALGGTTGPFDQLGINTSADETNRLAVAGAATLLSHVGTDHRLVVNKSTPGDTASLILQTGFSGQAEIGLTGNNDLSFKVQGEDAGLDTAMLIATSSGRIGIGTVAPTAPLHITSDQGSQVRLAPVGHSLSLESIPSIMDFWSTFDSLPGDQAPRRTASVRVAFDGGAWGNEVMSFHVGGSFDQGGLPIERMRINSAGYAGIGTTTPSAPLHVDGAIRVGNYTSMSLPNATALGAGSIIYATNAPAGPGVLVSDGDGWRRISDNSLVG